MNERNVAALTAIIERLYGVKLSEPGKYPVLARELAAEGVLAPSALTDEEGWDVGGTQGSALYPDDVAEVGTDVRAALERIAKGE